MCGAPALRRARRRPYEQRADGRVRLRAALQQVADDGVVVGAAGHQCQRRLAVQALALGAREVVGHRDGDQAVGEALAARAEQAGGQQRIAGQAQLADGDARQRGDHVRRGAVADHRERRDDRPVARGQRRQPPAHDVARDRRDGRSVAAGFVERLGAVGGDLAAELAEQPRVAPDGAMAVATHRAPACRAPRGG